MKVLNRPMFRMGGPIKEGIMSGIQEPKRGRVDGPGSYAGRNFNNPIDRTVGGASMVFPAEITSMMPSNASKVFADISEKYQTPVDPTINTTDKYIEKIVTKGRRGEEPKPIKIQIENPDFEQKYETVTTSRGDKKIPIEALEKSIYNTEPPIRKESDFLNKSGPEKGVIDEVIENKGNNDDQPNKKEKINSILEGLGYDRAQKNALYDAMIKAGQRISRTGLGAENLVSDVIAETSQSYDKPEKLREAANLMQVQQDLKLDQIKASKDTEGTLEKNAKYLLEAGIVDNPKDAVLSAQGKATEANDIFFEARQKLNSSQALDQTALTLGSRGKFGEGIVFKNKVPKKYKGEPIEKFLDSGAFRGDGLYTADGKIMLIQDGKIKSELIVKGSIEEGLFSFGGDD